MRAGGEIVDSRTFIKDTTPPAVAFSDELPAATTADDVAMIVFNATDTSPVSFLCRLQVRARCVAVWLAVRLCARARIPMRPLQHSSRGR